MNIFSIVAALAGIFAKFGAGTASTFNMYQTVLPEELRRDV